VIRPWLGLQGREIDAQITSLLRMPLSPGYLVEVVYDGSPAERAGVPRRQPLGRRAGRE
jgi:S1-C subfamily serine protease